MVNTKFARFVLLVNGLVPLAILVWDALHGQLGANPVNDALHITGWQALMFLTISLAVTPIRKLSGLNWLVQFRRMLGLFGFFYAAVHFGIYITKDRGGSWESIKQDFWINPKPFLVYGLLAIVLMVPLAITSTGGMVRRLGPKRWGWLHTLVYPATILAVVHYWIEGKVITWDKQVFAGAVAVFLAFRWVSVFFVKAKPIAVAPAPKPVAAQPSAAKRAKFWTGQLKIARVFRETPSVQTFRLASPDGGPLPFDYQAGQYLNLSLMIDGKKVPRSYTIASSPTRRDYCEVTVKREDMGVASRHLHDQLAEGHTLAVSAPGGKFVFTGKEADGVVLIAGGVGITPMMSIVRYLTDDCWPGKIDLFFSVRSRADIIFAEEIGYLAKRFQNFRPHIFITRDADPTWTGLRGRITGDLLLERVPDLKERLTFVCGPIPMLEPMRELLLSLGVPPERIKYEAFTSPSQAPAAADLGMNRLMSDDTGDVMSYAMPGSVESDAADEGEAAADGPIRVTFARSQKAVAATSDRYLLEVAEDAGVDLPFDCRAGICGTCKTRLVSGKVTMDTEDALTPADRAAGIILPCQAHAIGSVTLDA